VKVAVPTGIVVDRAVPGFGDTETVNIPSAVPDPPTMVTHGALDIAVQGQLALTGKVPPPPDALAFKVAIGRR
jgi:hypothetical protein